MKTMNIAAYVSLLLPLGLAGCFFDTSGDPADIDDGGTDTGDDTSTSDAGGSAGLSGTITISAGLNAGSYAEGTVFFAFMEECPSMSNQSPAILFSAAEESMDLSTEGASRLFALNGAPATTGYLWAFLDSNGNADPSAPDPDTDDAIVVDCGDAITLQDGEAATGLTVTLGMSML